MQLSRLGEFGLIKLLQKKFRLPSNDILTGIGDDAAVVKTTGSKLLVTSDMMVEGIHFDLSFISFYQLGYKFLAVNISDILAMGGNPEYFLVSLAIPETFRVENIEELYSGIKKISDKFRVRLIGGDTCASGHDLTLSGTLIGNAERIITRSGARPGDGIYVTGTPGDSAMGLRILKKAGRRVHKFSPATDRLKLIKKHLLPEPIPLPDTSGVTSMIDVSDGLLIDLTHLCDGSKVGAIIYNDKVPISGELGRRAKSSGKDAIRFALNGGEDYLLLFTAPPDYKTDAYRIGEIIKKGRYIIDGKGRKTIFGPEGYEHFKSKE